MIPVVDYGRIERIKINNDTIPFNTATLIYMGIFLLTGLILFTRYQKKNKPNFFSSL